MADWYQIRGKRGDRTPLIITRWLVGHYQQYFSYIVADSFIGGGNRSIRRKPPIRRKSLTNFIT
jgi:hypothetical protein